MAGLKKHLLFKNNIWFTGSLLYIKHVKLLYAIVCKTMHVGCINQVRYPHWVETILPNMSTSIIYAGESWKEWRNNCYWVRFVTRRGNARILMVYNKKSFTHQGIGTYYQLPWLNSKHYWFKNRVKQMPHEAGYNHVIRLFLPAQCYIVSEMFST